MRTARARAQNHEVQSSRILAVALLPRCRDFRQIHGKSLAFDASVDKSVIILSSGELDVTLIMAAARIFGWNTLITDNLDSIQKLPQDGVAAILFDHNAVGGSWLEGTSRLRRI